MSQENVELTRRAFDAIVRRDLNAFVALHDPRCDIKPLLAAVAGDFTDGRGCGGGWTTYWVPFPTSPSALMTFASLATGP